jgi:hypothetical protein
MYVSTGRTNVTKRGRSWLGVDWRGRQSSKGVNCDILTQGLIWLIKYLYHQGIPSFLEAQLKRTLGLSMFSLEQFQDGWPTGKSSQVHISEDKNM